MATPGADRATALRKEAKAQKQKLESVLRFSHAGTARPGPAPFEMEAQFVRGALRNTYLSLLFTCAFQRTAHNVDVLVWNDTTYIVISAFREQLARLEKEAASAQTKRRRAPKGDRRSAKVGEYQRALKDVRKFLQEELKFWETLAVRIVRMFGLDELRPVLQRLGLDDSDATRAATTDRHAVMLADDAEDDAGFDFAYPEAQRKRDATLESNRHQLLETLQRVLTYCGDLVRYREMHAAMPTDLAKQRKQPATARPAEFTRAMQFYHEAHLLLPDHGNPANQLAVVATFLGDHFGAMYQYYRALCVAVHFDNARFNLYKLLDKSLHHWEASSERTDALRAWREAKGTDVPTIDTQWTAKAWLESLVMLHAMLAQRAELDGAALLSDAVLRRVPALAEAPDVHAADYLRMVVTAVCAASHATPTSERRARAPFSTGLPVSWAGQDGDAAVQLAADTLRMGHIVDLLTALLDIARRALSEGGRAEVLLRILPALRIGGKWVRGHVDALDAFAAESASTLARLAPSVGSPEHDGVARFASILAQVPLRTQAFWRAYADVGSLLPRLAASETRALPEDPDLGALLPLRAAMPVPHMVAGASDDEGRIIDFLADVDAIAAHEKSPMHWDAARSAYVYGLEAPESDDPVALAMRAMDTQRDAAAPALASGAAPPMLASAAWPRTDTPWGGPVDAPAWRPPAAWPGWTPPPTSPASMLLFGSAVPGWAPTESSIWGAPSRPG